MTPLSLLAGTTVPFAILTDLIVAILCDVPVCHIFNALLLLHSAYLSPNVPPLSIVLVVQPCLSPPPPPNIGVSQDMACFSLNTWGQIQLISKNTTFDILMWLP